jgi:hypothetical protein
VQGIWCLQAGAMLALDSGLGLFYNPHSDWLTPADLCGPLPPHSQLSIFLAPQGSGLKSICQLSVDQRWVIRRL